MACALSHRVEYLTHVAAEVNRAEIPPLRRPRCLEDHGIRRHTACSNADPMRAVGDALLHAVGESDKTSSKSNGYGKQ